MANRNTKTKRRKSRRKSRKKLYRLSDYKSGDGMLTSVWGPSAWHFLHTLSFNYPVKPSHEQKCQYRDFVLALGNVLPCKYCRINFKKNLRALPLKKEDMASRDTFSRWVYRLHEHVNKMLKKKSGLSYEDVRDRYEHFRARCGDKDKGKGKKGAAADHKSNTMMKGRQGRKGKRVRFRRGTRRGSTKRICMYKLAGKKTKKKCRPKEKGCTVPYYGKRSKCVLKIVPKTSKLKHSLNYL